MAGIYIHVPFCKTRCIYCDFFTRTDRKQENPYIHSLCREIELRADYLENESIDTIYFGGGTPSQLNVSDLQLMLSAIKCRFVINDNAEITLEANPDDLDDTYLSSLVGAGFNRLSIGIQSFDNDLLHFLNRRHSAEKAIDAVTTAKKAGFDNISIDLMYGLPQQTMPMWGDTLSKAIDLGIQHISSYHLIYEDGTKLFRLLKQDKVNPVDEDTSVDMFSYMIDRLTESDFIHYEISNFGKEGFFSRHNSSYWLDAKYLGLGPAAHSYNRQNRCWNILSIPKYIEGVKSGIPEVEIENLDERTRYNDFILTGLRTMWGINVQDVKKKFNPQLLEYFEKNIQKHIDSDTVSVSDGVYKLNRKGIFISDSIMSDLMYVE